jgi:hypothetical protein
MGLTKQRQQWWDACVWKKQVGQDGVLVVNPPVQFEGVKGVLHYLDTLTRRDLTVIPNMGMKVGRSCRCFGAVVVSGLWAW